MCSCEHERVLDGARGSRPCAHVSMRECWLGHKGRGRALMQMWGSVEWGMRVKAMHSCELKGVLNGSRQRFSLFSPGDKGKHDSP